MEYEMKYYDELKAEMVERQDRCSKQEEKMYQLSERSKTSLQKIWFYFWLAEG